MYSTCIFCHTGLGRNEAIEQFPVGRRLAFDAARGRLWVVCRQCERWNLSPLEERWEAIEECEKLFRDTRLRVSTDNIGLAKLKEGTTLIRVGEPQRPEMAAWRYGDQFHRRRRKHLVWLAAGTAAIGTVGVLGPAYGLVGTGAVQVLLQAPNLLRQRIVARVPVKGTVLRLNAHMLGRVTLAHSERSGFKIQMQYILGWEWLGLHQNAPTVELADDDALRAARHLFPAINRAGGAAKQVTEAVNLLESARNPEHLFKAAAKWEGAKFSVLPIEARLAMEMSLHEQDERRALEGELVQLEDRWREAEEVAAIADDMFVPSGVSAMLNRLKRRDG